MNKARQNVNIDEVIQAFRNGKWQNGNNKKIAYVTTRQSPSFNLC